MTSNSDIPFAFNLVLPEIKLNDYKSAMKFIAKNVSPSVGVSERILYDHITRQNSRMDIMAMQGAAALHLRLSGLTEPFTALARFSHAIDVDAPDGMPVDLVFLLITPEKEGAMALRWLSRWTRLLRNPQICAMLRTAPGESGIQNVISQSGHLLAAA